MRYLVCALALVASAGGASACTIPKVQPPIYEPAPGKTSRADADSVSAWYTLPTTRYAHGVLGDSIEAGGLAVATLRMSLACPPAEHVLDEAHVFEDLAPRLVDLNGDGAEEIITVRSHKDKGAQLAIYATKGLRSGGDRVPLVATTPYIGTANRWLAPAGTGDFDGDGRVEVAYVETPHLGKTLRFWRLERGELRQIAALKGVTNHRIGEAFISSATRTCDGTTQVLLASADWRRTVAVSIEKGSPVWEDLGPWEGLGGLSSYTRCP